MLLTGSMFSGLQCIKSISSPTIKDISAYVEKQKYITVNDLYF